MHGLLKGGAHGPRDLTRPPPSENTQRACFDAFQKRFKFTFIFGSIFGRFWSPLEPPLSPQIHQSPLQIDPKCLQRGRKSSRRCTKSGPRVTIMLRNAPNSSKKSSSKSSLNFHPIWDRFRDHFGGQFGSQGAPQITQDPPKTVKKPPQNDPRAALGAEERSKSAQDQFQG